MTRRSSNHRLNLPPLELECIKVLWARGESTVHAIRSDLMPARSLAYTTVMTVMDRLARKGVVERQRRGRAHVYRAAVSSAEVRDFALDRLVKDFFRGSRDALRRHLENGGREPATDDAVVKASPSPPARTPPELASDPGPTADDEAIDPSLL